MSNIESREFELPQGWGIQTLTTPASTLHAVRKSGSTAVAFGIKGTLDWIFLNAMVGFLDTLDTSRLVESSILPASLGAFDACAFLVGSERKFMRGWDGDGDMLVHAFPVFSCELDRSGRLPPFASFFRRVDVFVPNRQPEPNFTFKMHGVASALRADQWRSDSYSSLKGFVGVLSNDKGSTLEVRNRNGEILRFSDQTGWDRAIDRVHTHVVNCT